jgi:group I intron endonuclease
MAFAQDILSGNVKLSRSVNCREHGRNLVWRCDMPSIPHIPGIYQICCTPTAQVYIGGTKNLYRRWIDHRKTLRNGVHINGLLQEAWNLYGEHSFVFHILEFVALDAIHAREQYWIDANDACNRSCGFNIAPQAGTSYGVVYSPEACEHVSIARSAPIDGFIAPDGTLTTITHMRSFCREHGLKSTSMYALALGKQVQHRGWRHRNATQPVGRGFKHEWRGFIDPHGTPVPPFRSLGEFCAIHGLNRTTMRKVYLGIQHAHRGWTCQRVRDDTPV